jgi:SagB-type dehydrogenase family enzyme
MTSKFVTFYREATNLSRETLGRRGLDWASQPESCKSLPGVERVHLSPPGAAPVPGGDLFAVFSQRRSRREFTGGSISQETLASLLWACQGVTARHGPYLLRTAPSAGALYPFETYASVQAVEGWQPCLAHLHVPSFALELIQPGHQGRAIARAALGQSFLASAAVVVLWTAVLARGEWKYGDRALRYIGLDLGHVCQNLCLTAEALGLGCCPVAAFLDREMNDVLGVDGEAEFAYYLAAVGPLEPRNAQRER